MQNFKCIKPSNCYVLVLQDNLAFIVVVKRTLDEESEDMDLCPGSPIPINVILRGFSMRFIFCICTIEIQPLPF